MVCSCAIAPFTVAERSLIIELRLDDIGAERRATILEETFAARRNWVIHCAPKYTDFVRKFAPLKEFGSQVITAVFYNCICHLTTVVQLGAVVQLVEYRSLRVRLTPGPLQ